MASPTKFSPEVKERAVRLLREHQRQYGGPYGVEPICGGLEIAPSSYDEARAHAREP